MPSEMLRWPFRIILYVFSYIAWAMVSLLILALFPAMSGMEAINVMPSGWIPIAAIFFADLYFTQLRGKKPQV